jgi:hypothetical protein
MQIVKREVTWIHEDAEGNPSEIGEKKFTIAFRSPQSFDDCITLCGSEERLYDLIEQKMATYANPSKKKFMESKDESAADQVIAKVIAEGETADLISNRGTGVAAKAAKFDELSAVLGKEGATLEDKLAALAAMGYDLTK